MNRFDCSAIADAADELRETPLEVLLNDVGVVTTRQRLRPIATHPADGGHSVVDPSNDERH
jgi:hypothetical protein